MTNLNFAGLILAILFIALILTKKNKLIQDYYLAFFIFLLGTYLVLKYIFQNKLELNYPIIIYFDIYYWVLLGPTLYVYTLISICKDNRFKSKYLFTLIPALLVTILFYQYIFILPLDFISEEQKTFPIYVDIGAIIWLYNSPIFYILTILTLRKHRKSIVNFYSSRKSVDLKWLYYLSNGFAVFLFLLLFKTTIRWLFNWEILLDFYGISVVVTVLYIFGIGFFGFKQQGIFNNLPNFNENSGLSSLKTNNAGNKNGNGNYQKSAIDETEAAKIISKLKILMAEEEPFLECELNLPMLANKIGVSTHKLSQVINKYFNKNFFDYINEYRINKVKSLLSDSANNHFKIIELAYQSGFNSKTTFYNLFKKNEGLTPSEFRQKFQS